MDDFGEGVFGPRSHVYEFEEPDNELFSVVVEDIKGGALRINQVL